MKPATSVEPVYRVGISLSFAVLLTLGILTITIAAVLAGGLMFGKSQVRDLQVYSMDRNYQLARTLFGVASAYPLDNKTSMELSGIFAGIVMSEKTHGIRIHEVLILGKKGEVLSHNDFSKVSPRDDSVNMISDRYNKDAFQKALTIPRGEIQVSPWPFEIPATNNTLQAGYLATLKLVHLYSTPLFNAKGEVIASIHIAMEDTLLQAQAEKLLHSLGQILLVSVVFALLLSALLIVAVHGRFLYVQRTWEEAIRYRLENEYVKEAFSRDVQGLQNKITELERKTIASPVPPRKQEAVDAIFIEDEKA